MEGEGNVVLRELGTMELLALAGGLKLHELRWIERRFKGALKWRKVGHDRLWDPGSVELVKQLKARIRRASPPVAKRKKKSEKPLGENGA